MTLMSQQELPFPPPPNDRGRVHFSHRCLVPTNFFPQRKSGFCRRYQEIKPPKNVFLCTSTKT